MRKIFLSGVAYTAAAKYSQVFITILIGAILARLLTPQEFGIIAIITVFVTFFNLLSNFGIGPAVVQSNNITELDLKSIFSGSVVLGVFFAGLFFLSAPYIAAFYEESALLKISRILSLSIFFYSAQVVPNALTQKKLKFKKIGIITVVIQCVGGISAIVLAYKGFSYYSLVFKSVFDSFVSFCAFFYLSPIGITFKIKKSALDKIVRFSIFQFMFNFINYFSRNADNLLIGKFLGAPALGFYDRSYRLMSMPVANLTHVITPVLLPILAKHQDNKKMIYDNYLKLIGVLATVGFPLSVFLFFVAEEIILIVYGYQWFDSIPVFKLLALTVGIQIILSSIGSIFQIINRTDLLFLSGLISAILMVGGIFYGVFIKKSLISIGYGLIFAFVISFFQSFFILFKWGLKGSFLVFIKKLIFPFLLTIGLGVFLKLSAIVEYQNLFIAFLYKSVSAFFVFGLIFIIPKKNRTIIKSYISKFSNWRKR